MIKIKWILILAIAASISVAPVGYGEDLEPITSDINGDGSLRVLSFGDSITFGVGDNGLTAEASMKGGYPNRAETLLGFLFDNEGLPGEQLTDGGDERLVSLAASSPSDYLLILEGANDAYRSIEESEYRSAMQRAVNAASVLGKSPVLMTLPRPCCDHGAQVPTSVLYSMAIRNIALSNQLPYVDLEKAWYTTCFGQDICELYNTPEGLHPNAKGYDVIAQTVAARFLGIDIFASDGAAQLEQALSLEPGTVKVKPEVQTVE